MGELLEQEIHTGFWDISNGYQADIATEEVGTTSFPYRPENLITRNAETIDDFDDLVDGKLGQDAMKILRWTAEGGLANRATPHMTALLLSMILSDVSTTGAGPYVHRLEVDPATVIKPTRTMVISDGNETLKYIGMTCTDYLLRFSRADHFADFEATLMGRGSELTGVFSQGTKTVESYLKLADGDVEIDGSWNGTAYTPGTSKAAATTFLELPFSDGRGGGSIESDYQVGETAGDNDAAYRSQMQRMIPTYGTIKWNFVLEDAVWRTRFQAGTEFVFYANLDAGANSKIEVVYPRCRMRVVNKVSVDGKLHVETELTVLEDDSYNPAIVLITNDTAIII